MKLPNTYYKNSDVVFLAKDLIGKVLCTEIDGQVAKGIITETEAYNGVHDKACHAYGGRRTDRTEIMFGEGGKAYVYLCYGIHHLFNIVTGPKDDPTAVLIRGVEPLEGKELFLERRKKTSLKNISAGPGTLSQAMAIKTDHTGEDLVGETIWIEDHGIKVPENELVIGPRIGIDYAEEDAFLPYRFLWKK